VADDDARTDTVELIDPRAIRAIAHPARMIVIDALFDQGLALTATQAAELAGTTPSAMSYHLRALSRFGIVTRAPATDGRERPWIRAAKHIAIRPSASASSTSATTATGAVLASVMDIDHQRLLGAVQRVAAGEGRLPLDVVAAYSHTTLLLTPEEATELMKKLDELVSALRLEDRTDAPAEAGRLTISIATIPDPTHPGALAPDDERN
jgi:DNA-binding transcriptional ArsR family regulator